jgi:malate dehydrogenase (oxaloacetate-decarboxylating)
MEDIKVIVNGVGAAGVACSKMVMAYGVRNIVGFDRAGAIYKGRTENMNFMRNGSLKILIRIITKAS